MSIKIKKGGRSIPLNRLADEIKKEFGRRSRSQEGTTFESKSNGNYRTWSAPNMERGSAFKLLSMRT